MHYRCIQKKEKNKVMWVGSCFEVQRAKSKSGVQVICFSLGTALAENSLLAYDGRSIKIVVSFFFQDSTKVWTGLRMKKASFHLCRGIKCLDKPTAMAD